MRVYRVADWMSTPPITVTPTTSLAEAQHIMAQRHTRRLPVIQHGRLIGIVTWGDLRAAQPPETTTLSMYEWRALLDEVTIAECMTRDPITIAPDAPVLEAAQMMVTHKFGGLPVVEHDQVVGMITESDLFRLLIAESTNTESNDTSRVILVCHHCGEILRQRHPDTLDPDDTCWRCHNHLHRCENCRYFDAAQCLLGRDEHTTTIPGQYCPAFSYLPSRAITCDNREHNEHAPTH